MTLSRIAGLAVVITCSLGGTLPASDDDAAALKRLEGRFERTVTNPAGTVFAL